MKDYRGGHLYLPHYRYDRYLVVRSLFGSPPAVRIAACHRLDGRLGRPYLAALSMLYGS
jgi:hypothetical protein